MTSLPSELPGAHPFRKLAYPNAPQSSERDDAATNRYSADRVLIHSPSSSFMVPAVETQYDSVQLETPQFSTPLQGQSSRQEKQMG